MTARGTEREALDDQIEETQIKPVAGIWACPACGRRIQVITESDVEKKQAFVCVCGTSMEPGEEHARVAERPSA
jgi:hypothetical protein